MKKDYEAIADELAYIIYRMIEGDCYGAMEAIEAHGYVDEDQE